MMMGRVRSLTQWKPGQETVGTATIEILEETSEISVIVKFQTPIPVGTVMKITTKTKILSMPTKSPGTSTTDTGVELGGSPDMEGMDE